MIDLLSIILSIAYALFKWASSEDRKRIKNRKKRREELDENDLDAHGGRMSNLFDRLLRKKRRSAGK